MSRFCFVFVVAPFCSCPVSLVSRNFCCRPQVCKVFLILLRPVGRRDLSAGPEQKEKLQGVFFCSGPGERQGKEKPRWAPARGQSKKKHKKQKKPWPFMAPPGLFRPDVVHQTFLFLARRVRRGRSKKKKKMPPGPCRNRPSPQ